MFETSQVRCYDKSNLVLRIFQRPKKHYITVFLRGISRMHPVVLTCFSRWQENSNYQATCNAAGQAFGYALGILGIRSSSKMSRRIWDLMYKYNYKIKQGIVNGHTMIYIYDYNTINTLETVHLHPFAIQFTFMYILVLGNKRHFRTLNAFGFVCNWIALQFQRFLIRFQV